MKPSVNLAFKELYEYYGSYNLSTVLDDSSRKVAQRNFRRFFPLLILHTHLDNSKLWVEPTKDGAFKIYLKEALSDSSQAMSLALHGHYKAAFLILRSAVENFVRCVGIAEDQGVLSIKSVYDLFDVVKDTSFVNSSPHALSSFQSLRSEYAAHCKHVHTADASHMAHTTLVGNYPNYRQIDADKFSLSHNKTNQNLLILLVLLRPIEFRSLHHNHFDIVSDALPVKIKQFVHQA